MRRRESQVLYTSFNTLCIGPSFKALDSSKASMVKLALYKRGHSFIKHISCRKDSGRLLPGSQEVHWVFFPVEEQQQLLSENLGARGQVSRNFVLITQ